MNNFISFIKSEIRDRNFFVPAFFDKHTSLTKIRLKEEENADTKIKNFFWILDDDYKETIAIKLPKDQKIQHYLKDRSNICDYVVFIPKENIAIVTELKGKRKNKAFIQLNLSVPFLKYVISIYNEEKELGFNPKKIIKLLIRDGTNSALPTNPGNRITYLKKEKISNKNFIICTTYDGCSINIYTFIKFLFGKEKHLEV